MQSSTLCYDKDKPIGAPRQRRGTIGEDAIDHQSRHKGPLLKLICSSTRGREDLLALIDALISVACLCHDKTKALQDIAGKSRRLTVDRTARLIVAFR